ncbi:FAD-dependent oxidoreductase [Siculibacillus lacustris]|uniref:FAD-dependent oxidoreductase n=1 Tax=Siculibacillus lacustris TaxID=1549641 RepID=A0A4Q9VKX1_9HYPH|nr:FAD-dependent oxidoreductase [Siculibacillus lacustris]TBW36090.1 FAD-dependent oxidoreductase [Siculibacillus lacustris]
MVRVSYGVWDGVVRDNRGLIPVEIAPDPDLEGFEYFNDGNPIRAFIGDRGFVVFDPEVDLVDALWRHMDRAAEESCGKCTPCRVGAPLIRDALAEVRAGRGSEEGWQRIAALAHQMAETSLCYLGQSSANALLAAIEHFPEHLKPGGAPAPVDNGMSYVTAPCVEACPSKVAVPRYIDFIKDGRPDLSLGVILRKYPMAATCGRVCVRFCEMACRRNAIDEPVGIKILKRYVADQQAGLHGPIFSPDMIPTRLPDSMRVAVVGGGPAGVSCAYHLLLRGYHVDVLEAAEVAGGMARSGIPSYRLPKDVLKAETDTVEQLGGHFRFGQALGRDFTIDDLFEQGYKAVFLGLGCAKGTLLGVADEDPSLKGYFSGIDFLLEVHNHVEYGAPLALHGEVAVVGGGNVAMDCVRSALRLGASKVHLIYRRTEADMPADHEEIEAAKQEGVIFHCLTNPSRILSEDGRIVGMDLIDMRQTVPDKKGRIGVEPIPGTEHAFRCDVVVAAIGQQVDKQTLPASDGVQLDKWGCVAINPQTLVTTRMGVFAGGDCASGASTLIHAMAMGLKAARAIDDYLRHGHARFFPRTRMRRLLNENKLLSGECFEVPVAHQYRIDIPNLSPDERRRTFEEVEKPITAAEAYREAARCLRCYRVYSVVTETAVPGGTR